MYAGLPAPDRLAVSQARVVCGFPETLKVARVNEYLEVKDGDGPSHYPHHPQGSPATPRNMRAAQHTQKPECVQQRPYTLIGYLNDGAVL